MPKTKKQFETIKDERRQQILSCALELFCTNGFNATKIDDISKLAGVSHGLLYHYFRTKEEIFSVLFFEGAASFDDIDLLLNENPSLTASEKFVRLTDLMLEKIAIDKRVCLQLAFRQNINLIKRDFEDTLKKYLLEQPNLNVPHNAHMRQRLAIERLFEDGLREGCFLEGNAKELALLYWTIMHGLTMQRLHETQRRFPSKPLPRNLILRCFLKDNTKI